MTAISPRITASAIAPILVARQPIFDRATEVVGYELLYRAAEGRFNALRAADDDLATAEVLVNACVEIGLAALVGGVPAWINVPRGYLTGRFPLPTAPGSIVVEVLEHVELDDEVVRGLRQLSEEGHPIALDDIEDADAIPDAVLACVDVVKLDVMAIGVEAACVAVASLKSRAPDVRVLAEKVETREELRALQSAGFDLFQGYFLCRPEIVQGKRPAAHTGALALMAELNKPDASFETISALLRRDVNLGYRLLKLVNSAQLGVRHEVRSVDHAATLIGLRRLKQWLMLMVFISVAGKPPELARTALIRSRMCERMAELAHAADPDSYATAGLFSVMDALFDRPMAELAAELPLSDAVRAALVDGAGPIGGAIAAAIAQETGDIHLRSWAGLSHFQVFGAWLDAIRESRALDDLRS